MLFSELLLNKINKYHEGGINSVFVSLIAVQIIITANIIIKEDLSTASFLLVIGLVVLSAGGWSGSLIRSYNMELSKVENYIILHLEQIDNVADEQKQKILESIINFQFHTKITYKDKILAPLQTIINSNN